MLNNYMIPKNKTLTLLNSLIITLTLKNYLCRKNKTLLWLKTFWTSSLISSTIKMQINMKSSYIGRLVNTNPKDNLNYNHNSNSHPNHLSFINNHQWNINNNNNNNLHNLLNSIEYKKWETQCVILKCCLRNSLSGESLRMKQQSTPVTNGAVTITSILSMDQSGSRMNKRISLIVVRNVHFIYLFI